MKNKLTIFFYLVLCSFAYTQELVVSQDPQADIVPNVAPQTEARTGRIWNNSTETTNFQLVASDQDGDALTFSIVTPPANGTITITETQTIGTTAQFVASYTPNAAFTTGGTDTEVDSFTFKVNDGNEDSNISTVTILSYEKHEKHNWTKAFSGNSSNTIYDNQGNSYQVGSFSTLTNFLDGTSLNANYTPNISYQDAYIIKLNDSGELQWSKIVSGEKSQSLEQIIFSADGNLIVKGSTDDTAIFSDGSQLGSDGNNDQDFVVKFNANSGDVLWKVLDESYAISDSFQNSAVLSNGDILFFPWSYNSSQQIKKLDSSNGTITDVPLNGYISTYGLQEVGTDSNDNIYISSRDYTSDPDANLIKYDSNLNLIWEITISDNGSGNNYAYVGNIEYDSINDLLYVSGSAREANINPLGDAVITTNNANSGTYFAAYNTNGILQFSHGFETDANSSMSLGDIDIFNNKIVFF